MPKIAEMSHSKQLIDFLVYLILLGSTIFVNKYVLSVLNFTYPTIFQGWQTLVGGILLRILLSNKCLSVSSTDLDKAGFISLLPSFLFFSAGIVASSKALANLSVPMFLCLQNTLGSMLYLMEIIPSGGGMVALGASLITIGTAVAAVLADIDMTFSDSPYFWMMVHLACVAVQTLHSKIADARYTAVDRLYFSYVFSVVVLAPASLYLEEAFEVLRFPHAVRYDFYAGCLFSGVLGLFLNLTLMKVKRYPLFSVVDPVGRLLTSVLALATFPDVTTSMVNVLVCINLISAVFVPVPVPKDEDETEESVDLLREGV
ncbi:transmembrane protein 241-like [Penaeus monodon]|uniref:transmembrane protein 241-like n=1 Tax=Penaeus monodon TaxID=6687 RepID=UPI0018A79AD7|nr:transmembrane protein 241-like [Penaeus monodon]XP_037782654.1 transmembrane protein 241-like [Penaeus monodon]XP_037782655.1 transmembrane protein 241-like [Penaeus monodon]